MKQVAAIILSGGQGARLFPLTMSRCKPALGFGGKYRLIDFPLSNAIHSGCQKIFVLTQFLSASLHQHILSSYQFGNSLSIEILAAEEKPQNRSWYQGTADAIRQHLDYIEDTDAEYLLILSGDQLYHMDFSQLLECALKTDADMVIAALPIDQKDASRMGVMKIDQQQIITDFFEKPQLKSDLERFKLSDSQYNFLGSMGIYLFKRQVLIDLLNNDTREDFGKHLIPTLVEKGNVAACIHEGYWKDIGTIESYFSANIALTQPNPAFDCFNEKRQIYTKPVSLPGAKIVDAKIKNSILCEGTVIDNAEITNSIIGPRSLIKPGTTITNSYLIGNDFFKSHEKHSRLPNEFQIGTNCTINKTIIDRHVRIGNNVTLINQHQLPHYDGNNIHIRDGVIIIPHGVSIPDGFIL
jgi:glucose-1-phosphate adenylyltransferase